MSAVGFLVLFGIVALTGGILTGTSTVSKSSSLSETPKNLKFSIDIKNSLRGALDLHGSYIFHDDMSSEAVAVVAGESNRSVLLGRARTGTHGVIAYRDEYNNDLFAIAFSVSTTAPQSNWFNISALPAGAIVDQNLYHGLRPVENIFMTKLPSQKLELRVGRMIRASLDEDHNKMWKLKVNLNK